MESNICDREKIKKIKNIVEREIEKELVNKQNEVTDISEKIKHILHNLDLLKYIVAVNYYDQNPTLTPKKNLVTYARIECIRFANDMVLLAEDEKTLQKMLENLNISLSSYGMKINKKKTKVMAMESQEDENEEEKAQTQIHPCIKKLMPFRSNYNKSFGDMYLSHAYETRNSKKTNSSDSTSVSIKSENEQEKANGSHSFVKMPQYIPPLPSADEKVGTVNSTRGSASKECYRIIVGNISKWIPPDLREGNSTHKWMVYIRNKDESKDVTKQLRKVRYFLHESYKPHDIIDVTSPPFHLTRRGWGEFPVRVQLHFNHPLNKPFDIIHNLKLDMTCSGIQMLGGETVVEVWLHQSNESIKNTSKPDHNTSLISVKEESVKEKQDVFDGSFLTSINGFKPSNCIDDIKQEMDPDVVIKQEPEDTYEHEQLVCSKTEEVNLAINNSRKFLLDRRKTQKIIEIEHNYLKSDECVLDKPIHKLTHSLLKTETIKTHNGEKPCKNGTVIDPVQINQIFSKKSQDRLSKFELKSSKSEEEIFKNLKSIANKLETETQSKYCMKMFRNMYLVNIVQRAHATKLTSVESLIRWFVQRWPIITKLSLDPTYKTVHPYSSPTEEEFLKYNIGKQRSAEWFRAKAIQKVIKSLKSVIPIEEEIWSTKQILLWCRFHGYSPSSFQKTIRNDFSDSSEIRNKRLKSIETSSDSEDGSWDASSKKFKTGDDKFFNGLVVNERKKNYKRSRRKDFMEEVLDRHKNYKQLSTCTDPNEDLRFGAEHLCVLQSSGSDVEIDVVELDKEPVRGSPSKKKESKLTVITTPPNEASFNKFVCDTAKQIGIKITEEEIAPGVRADSVSRVFSQSVSSFLEELLRRSFAQAWLRNGDRCPECLELNDILATLIEYDRFDIFTNRGLGTSNPEKS